MEETEAMLDERKERLVIDGNAIYELDLECLRKKEAERKEKESNQKRQGKRQRG